MKKFLKVSSAIFVILIATILAVSYISYNSWSPGDVDAEPDPSLTGYFLGSFEECRDAFRANARDIQEKYEGTELFSLSVGSKVDNDLTIDFCYLPPENDKSKLLIISSGIHGIEGITGSAVQAMLMDKALTDGGYSETGILFVHSINPYGFKYLRRVSENNVDMNRNWDADVSLFSTENQGYSELYSMLNPEGKVSTGSLKNRFFLLVAIERLIEKSMKSLRQAILQGQYEYPEGLYFGGTDFEPQMAMLMPVFKQYAEEYETVLNIDLHTGYGELGVLHLFPNPVDDPVVKGAMEHIFKGYVIDWGDSDDFYTINGSFTDFIGLLMPDKLYVPMVFEYGTLNSQTTLGSIRSIHNMILENQGFQHGYCSADDERRVKANFMEMYNPSSEAWRSKVLFDTRELMEKVMVQLENMQ
jgi:hypothetical protein